MSTLIPDIVWGEALRQLAKDMPAATFSTWVKPLNLIKIEEVGADRGIATFVAESPYVAQQAELRCYTQLKKAIDSATNRQFDLLFQEGSASQERKAPQEEPQQEKPFSVPSKQKLGQPEPLFAVSGVQLPKVDRLQMARQKARLREDFTFDNFAVSGSNEMAYNAAQAVAAAPGRAYNPLFLWGGVGVGKTHLMQSVGNTILAANPETPLLYCMGEEFLNEIIAAIKTKRTMEFKERYRKLQVLLIDDIQFIAGKNTAQEEFFHTFNAITRAGGQVIMTSDRPPHEMSQLEDRLRSRFEGGLIIDIQQPSFELRTAILLIKAQKIGLELPMELAQVVASTVESTRRLEGVLFRLHSAVRFSQRSLTEGLIREIMGQESTVSTPRKHLKPTTIIRAVTSHFRISLNTLKSNARRADYVRARHVAMYLLRSELNMAYKEIGANFGGRDHTTALHAIEKIQKDIEKDPSLAQDISAVRTTLLAS